MNQSVCLVIVMVEHVSRRLVFQDRNNSLLGTNNVLKDTIKSLVGTELVLQDTSNSVIKTEVVFRRTTFISVLGANNFQQ